jgi:hypothetical protein
MEVLDDTSILAHHKKPQAMIRLRVLYVKRIMDGTTKGDITHIGGITETGENWNIAISEAINGIKAGVWEFYLMEELQEIQISICSLNRTETFLAAKGRGYLHNLMEDLPDCTFTFEFSSRPLMANHLWTESKQLSLGGQV